MKKISREQLKYAQNRLYDIKSKEWQELEKTCWVAATADPLTFKEAIEAIKKGKVKPRTKTLGGLPMNQLTLSKSTRVIELFEFEISERKFDHKKSETNLKAHEAKWDRIFDRLFLGDAEEIMKLIADSDKS